MQNIFTINFLITCSECYYNEGTNVLAYEEDCKKIEEELGQKIFDEYQTVDDNIKVVEITDELYDKIYYLSKNKYAWHEFFGMVGTTGGYGEDIVFNTPAGSMTELKEGDWDKWKLHNTDYVVSEKLDGLSVILFYKDGCFIKAASRGDGHKGKDITRHILHIANVPKNISMRGDVEVRGELICPKIDIPNMIQDLLIETGKEYKNGRNTIAGFLNSKNTLLSVAKYAKFNAFDTNISYENEYDKFVILNKLNFDTPKYIVISGNKTEDDLIKAVTLVKTCSKYECDGIILTINRPSTVYEGFETGTINPKKSRKFKIGAIDNTAETTIKGITWQVSKSGILTPVCELEPVFLVGAAITRATGHNYSNMVKNKIGVGSRIKIIRSGDVIPKIEKVITHSDDLQLPNVETITEGVNLRLKDLKTPSVFVYEMMLQKLVFFCKSLGIDNIGPGNLECLMKWFDNKYNRYMNALDLLQLPESVLFNEIGVNGTKIYQSLKQAKSDCTEVDFMVALSAFGEGMGKSVIQSVFDKYQQLDVTETQLKMISGFGDTRIQQYLKYLPRYRKIKEALNKIGIKFNNVIRENISNKYADYVVCFTGCRDVELSKHIKLNGGIATDSWNKNVNLLVAKDPNSVSGKITKAREKGIKVISLEEAQKMFS